MSQEEPSINNNVLTFLGSVGGILIFGILLFVAYLPEQADPADLEAFELRQIKADDSRAAGQAKITATEVIDADKKLARIPVAAAMELTVQAYNAPAPAVEAVEPPAAE